MSFAAKYEILEPVTLGLVATFVARNVTSNERVVVHIFWCPEQKPDQSTVQWVLESFHAVAPDPVELVIDTGKYAGTSCAYLVTKMPSKTLLQEWVQSYEAGQQPTRPPAHEPAKLEEIAPQPIPAGVGRSEGTGSPSPSEILPSLNGPARNAPQRIGSSAVLPSCVAPPEKTVLDKEPTKTELSTGEFTSFFRGPFNGERAEETPNVSLEGPPAAQVVGDFTRIFGLSKDGSSSVLVIPPRPNDGSSAASDSGAFNTSTPPPARVASSADSPSTAAPPSVTSTPGLCEVEPRGPVGSKTESATLVFSGPERDEMSNLSSLPDGPSEYTRIVSGGPKSSTPAAPIASGSEDPSMGAASLPVPTLAAPAVPSPQVPATPAVPQFPHAGGYPQMPAPPAVPPVPRPGTARPAQVPWALIFTLNGLFVLAVLLVLYFALKH